MYLFEDNKVEEYVLDTENEIVKKVLDEIDYEGYPLQDFEKDYLIKMRALTNERVEFYEKEYKEDIDEIEYMKAKLMVINYILWHEPLRYNKPEIPKMYNRTKMEENGCIKINLEKVKL